MAYDYKPGEDEDVLKRHLIVGTIIVLIAIGAVLVLYIGLGIDMEMLKLLAKRLRIDATNVTFLFGFIMGAIALWALFREPAAGEGVNRRQTYFILLLILAGFLIAGTYYFKRLSRPTHEVTKTELCPQCLGSGRAKLRPEYPCGTCNGLGYITP